MARTIKELQAKFGKRRLKQARTLYLQWRNAQPDTSTMPGMLVLRNINGSNKAQYIQFYRDAIAPVEVRERSDRLGHSWRDLKADLRASTQNQVRVHLTVDGQIVGSHDYNAHTVRIQKIWYDFFGSDPDGLIAQHNGVSYKQNHAKRYDDNDSRVYFIVERGTSLTPEMLSQVYRENETNTCLFNPIMNWIKEKQQSDSKKICREFVNKEKKVLELIEQFPDGVAENQIQEVVDALKINIRINKVIEKRHAVYNTVHVNSKPKTFEYITTRKNHVDSRKGVDLWACTPIECTREELIKVYETEMEAGRVVPYKSYNDELTRVYTSDGAHQCAPTEEQEKIKTFEESTGLNEMKLDYMADADVSEFLHTNCHFVGTRDFKDVDAYRQCCNGTRCGSSSCCSSRSCCHKCCTNTSQQSLRSDYQHMDCKQAYANANKTTC